jgi:hypothetical protein
MSAPDLYSIYTILPLDLHSVYTISALDLLSVYTVPVPDLYPSMQSLPHQITSDPHTNHRLSCLSSHVMLLVLNILLISIAACG